MATKTYGTTFEYGNTADYATASGWTALARVINIKPMKVAAKDINITTLDSPDEFEESLAGLASGGECELTLEYSSTRAITLEGFYRVTKAFQVVYPDNTGWKFNGYVMEYGDEEIGVDSTIRTMVKIKVTGKPVRSASLTS